MDIYATSLLQAIVVLVAGGMLRWLWALAQTLQPPDGAAPADDGRGDRSGSDLSMLFVALALVVVAAARADMLHAALAWVFVTSQLFHFLLVALGRRALWFNMALAPALLALTFMVVLLWSSLF